MWQDIEQQRPTEIATMNGYIAKQAKLLAIPMNDCFVSFTAESQKFSGMQRTHVT